MSVAESYLVHTEEQLGEIARSAVDLAFSLGAEDASCLVRQSGGLTVRGRGRDIESATREGSQRLVVTVGDAGRIGRAVSESLSREAVAQAAEQALVIARLVEPHETSIWAAPEWRAGKCPDLSLYAPCPTAKGDLAKLLMQVDEGVCSVDTPDRLRTLDAGVATQDMRWALAADRAFCRTASASSHSLWCAALAERSGAMVRDGWHSQDRRFALLDTPFAVGEKAARRAGAKLGASSLSTRRCAVLFDALIATSLIAELASAISGGPQQQKMTFLPEALDHQVCPDHVDLLEDPFEPFGLASAAFDSEGVTGTRRLVVESGVVRGLFLGAASARKLGTRSTGNADGPANLTLSSRDTDPADDVTAMLQRLGTGLWLTEFLGGSVNPVTGAYSKAGAGFWIENGEVVRPVQNFTVAGSLPEMLAAITAIGSDVHRQGAYRTGSILIPDIQIAGQST